MIGIRFKLTPQDLTIYRSDGQPFLGFVEMDRQRQQAEALAAKLRELGIDPSSL